MPTAVQPPNATAADDWRTTDRDEIERRRQRARAEAPRVENRDASGRFPIFSNFLVHSPSGVTYPVEIRDLARRQFGCGCVDFRVNGLGTCKHVEAVLDALETADSVRYQAAHDRGSDRVDLVVDHAGQTLRVERNLTQLSRGLRRWFDTAGRLASDALPAMALELWTEAAAAQPALRISQEIAPWLECRRREAEGVALRRAYEGNVQSGRWPAHETRRPLYPYQREGMLHLACAERALLADELGLGKTVQAVAACALLHRLGRARRALVVTAASLKSEWLETIAEWTHLRAQTVAAGDAVTRLANYAGAGAGAEVENDAPFFLLVTYEQAATDVLAINERMRPDVVILDEAQRIKNWNAKTALAVKRLRSRYAFVLTGTPLESRLDELYSLVSFLDPSIFGPLFRFNREYLDFDTRGRPRGYKNLDRLRERLRPILLRRRKADVAAQLPGRTDRTFLVPLGDAQRAAYRTHEAEAARLCALARKRPLTPAQRERLLRELAMARMLCDTPYILERQRGATWRDAPPATAAEAEKLCPKLGELARLLRECAANPQVKVLVFSEWERMLELVRGLCQRLRIAHAFHAGSIPAGQRRAEVQRFKTDPACRVFLSTDTAGGSSLNLPQASVVIHCDQPWSPARLEARVARAWQPEQTRAVTVLHLVSEGTIEQRLVLVRTGQQALSERVLDDPRAGSKVETKLTAASPPQDDDLLDRLHALLTPAATVAEEKKATPLAASARPARAEAEETIPPAERPRAFSERAAALLNGGLLSIEERVSPEASRMLLVVVENGEAERARGLLEPLRARCFPPPPASAILPDAAAIGLEVIDRATADLLGRLRAAGLVGETTGEARRIYPGEGKASAESSGDRAARQFFTGIRAQLERIGSA